MAERDARGSPLWWVRRLERDLYARQAEMELMDRYYRGDHPLPFVTKAHNAKMRDEFRGLLEDSRSNFMRLVVEAVGERLRVDGFRLSAEDPQSDRRAWDIWQANQLDAESETAFIEALIKRVSYLSVWAGDEHPTIAVEDAMQTIVGYEAGSNYRRRAAALKVWLDEWTGERRANLYLRAGIYKFKGAVSESDTPVHPPGVQPKWEQLDGGFVANPLDVVPIVPLRNRPRLLCEGESEIIDVAPTQDRINGELFMRALAGYFGAHRQRWAVGLTLHENTQTGKPEEPFDIAVDRLIYSEDENVKFGEFGQTDLTGYIKAIEQDVLHIAVTTRTPRHYLIEQGQSPSGDAIRSAEAGLVKKAQRKARAFGEGLEEAIRLARRFAGEDDAPVDSEIVWADAETQVVGVWTDAVVKQFQAGLIPWEAALEKLGYTQTQIRRYAAQRQSDALLQAVLNPEVGEEPEG
ncbi:MAG: phage portal protein [Gaiellaceae bacterium]